MLPPAQLVVQLEPQLPEHVDWPAQLVVQPVPQFTLQSFFDWQSNVALLGGRTPPSAPPSPLDPSVHVPPEAHVHVEPLQEQAPLHSGELLPLEAPEHAITTEANAAGKASRRSKVFDMFRERYNGRAIAKSWKCLAPRWPT